MPASDPPKIIVEPIVRPPSANDDVRRTESAQPEATQRGGVWLVVVVYVFSAAALAAALYERFGT